MKPLFKRIAFSASCVVTGLSLNVHAGEHVDASLHLGLATSANSSYYLGEGDNYFTFPLVMAEYGRYYLQATTIGYSAYQGQNGQRLAIEIDRTFDGYESDDAQIFSGMRERKAAWEAGFVYEVPVGGGQFTGKLMTDVSNTHEGFSTSVDYERSFWKGESHLATWFVGGEYWDHAKTDYYYGVESNEAQPDRAAYSASDSHSFIVGGNALKQLSSRFTLFFRTEYRLVNDAVKDSPLVSSDNQWLTYAAFLYQF